MANSTDAEKDRLSRFFPALMAIGTLAAFILSGWAALRRALEDDPVPYLIGLSAVVICAYARVSWESPLRGAIRAALASWAGSVVGYLVTLIAFYAEHHRLTWGVELHEWLLVTTVWAYLGTDGWGLGVALALPSRVVGIYRGLRPGKETPLA